MSGRRICPGSGLWLGAWLKWLKSVALGKKSNRARFFVLCAKLMRGDQDQIGAARSIFSSASMSGLSTVNPSCSSMQSNTTFQPSARPAATASCGPEGLLDHQHAAADVLFGSQPNQSRQAGLHVLSFEPLAKAVNRRWPGQTRQENAGLGLFDLKTAEGQVDIEDPVAVLRKEPAELLRPLKPVAPVDDR